MRREEIATLAGVPSPAGEPVAAPILSPATLYFGGGTPSVLPLPVIRRIVEALQDAAVSKTGLPAHGKGFEEFTFEVNPEDIVQAGLPYASGLRELGVNRISMGVQSLDDGILRWMNRRHDGTCAREAFRRLRQAGFDNISIDLIYGLSQLTPGLWEETLDQALELVPEHISAYQLTVEEGSALAEMIEAGTYAEASDEACAAQYQLLCGKMKSVGYHHYEISNFAVPGKEAVHNSAYWRRVPYVGLGPGAHSLIGTDLRSWNSQQTSGWTSECEHLTPEQIREEELMLGLRTDRGACGMKIPEEDWFISDSIIAGLI
jgi:oxygen-independent coproporphyrinogen-3 oxidase